MLVLHFIANVTMITRHISQHFTALAGGCRLHAVKKYNMIHYTVPWFMLNLRFYCGELVSLFNVARRKQQLLLLLIVSLFYYILIQLRSRILYA